MKNYASVKMGAHILLWYEVFSFPEKIPRRGILGLNGICSPSFFRNLHIDFHSGWIEGLEGFLFLHSPSQHFFLADLLILAILFGVRCNLSVVLVYMSQMTNDFEYFFIYLLAICISSSDTCIFISEAHFGLGL